MVYEREREREGGLYLERGTEKVSRRTENRMNSFYIKYLVFCVPPQTVTT